jgi:hypothetical protein
MTQSQISDHLYYTEGFLFRLHKNAEPILQLELAYTAVMTWGLNSKKAISLIFIYVFLEKNTQICERR